MSKDYIQISPSSLDDYFSCPRSWFYSRHPDVPRKKDYPRINGIETHKHIAYLYKPTKKPRPFFYQSSGSAIRAWFNRWERALGQYQPQLLYVDLEQADKFKKIGAICIANYWKANVERPRPLEIETSYSATYSPGVRLYGRFDQVRAVSVSFIEKHRPELMENGQLNPWYNPEVIVDLKTDKESYDLRQFKENPSLEEEVRRQYSLHENTQATMYSWLYGKVKGRKPVGFVWYHLRSGKYFFTYRDDRDYANMDTCIWHYLENLNALSFPKVVGRHCQWCDYFKPCRENRMFLVSAGQEILDPGQKTPVLVPNIVGKDQTKQFRLKLKMPRKKRQPPKVEPVSLEQKIVLRNLPWDNQVKRQEE